MTEEKPAEMKKLGKTIKGFVHSVWSERKVGIMEKGLKAKFKNPELKKFLIGTREATIMEASPYDRFWGVGLPLTNSRIWNRNNWHGVAENTMGRLLHELRIELNRENTDQRQNTYLPASGKCRPLNRSRVCHRS